MSTPQITCLIISYMSMLATGVAIGIGPESDGETFVVFVFAITAIVTARVAFL